MRNFAASSALDRSAPDERDTRMHGHWLLLARAGWSVTALVLLGLDALGTPVTFHQLHSACVGNSCLVHQLAPAQLRRLLASGMSLDFYASYEVALMWVGTLVYTAIAAAIFARRSDDRMALFGAYTLLVFGAGTVFGPANALPSSNAVWALPVGLAYNAGPLAFYVFFCLFPSGHFAPRWIRWVALAWVLGSLVPLIPYLPLQALGQGSILFFLFFGLLVLAQVYRYRKVSTPMQREQTKWVVLGFVAGIGGFIAVLGLTSFGLEAGGSAIAPGISVVDTALGMLLWLIPISIGVAILRSRLWDIDVIINRTLVYGSLTLLLAAVYFGAVVGMQQLASIVTSQRTSQNPLIIVLSTLLIAALFTPLRRRIQRFIDRRFYRARYDTARTLERFAATLRSETDLRILSSHLVGVVDETMRPTHVSLWLRPAEREVAR